MEESNESENEKWIEICQLAASSLLPKLPYNFIYSCDDTDPAGDSTTDIQANKLCLMTSKTQSSQKLNGILTLLKSINVEAQRTQANKPDPPSKSAISSIRRQHLVPLIALLGEHYPYSPSNFTKSISNDRPWTSESNGKLVQEIILELYSVFKIFKIVDEQHKENEEEELLSLEKFFISDFSTGISPSKTIFGQLLFQFREKLVGKDDIWKNFPAAKSSFQWCLFQVKYPHLSDFIPGALQPVLNFHDDFEIQNQLEGVNAINYIIDNVNKAELCGSGSGSWCDVLYKSLTKLLKVFARDGSVVDKLLPLILRILKMLEKDPHNHSDQFTLYDEVLEIILQTIEFGSSSDNENATKLIWLKHLSEYLEIMGFATLHWFVRILRILQENTTCSDPKRWLMVLKCSRVCITNTWLKPDSESFVEIILRIVYNLAVFEVLKCDEQTREEILQSATECLQLLKFNSDYENVRKQLEEISTSTEKAQENDRMREQLLQPRFLEVWNGLRLDL